MPSCSAARTTVPIRRPKSVALFTRRAMKTAITTEIGSATSSETSERMSVFSNRALLEHNARVAAQLAVALAGRSTAIWLVDGDGQARELLDVGDAWIVDMSWSPDGRHLGYFASAPEGFTNALHVTTRAGEARRIATGLAEIVGWRE
jgi:tricorn protease-like protein